MIDRNVGSAVIFTSSTFEDAVKNIRKNEIDIAFIDLRMPKKNGGDFIIYLNDHPEFRRIRKVVLTETDPDSLLKASYENAVDAYLFKEDIAKNFQLILDQINALEVAG